MEDFWVELLNWLSSLFSLLAQILPSFPSGG